MKQKPTNRNLKRIRARHAKSVMATRGGARLRTTKEGSVGHAIAEAVRTDTAGRGTPMTLAECRAGFAARATAMPATYAAQFFSLVRRGILVAIDGRSSRTRYAHRDTAAAVRMDGDTVDDDALVVLRALRRAAAVAGGPVPTVAVAAALRDAGLPLASSDINAVRVRLQTLARSRRNGTADWHAPRVASSSVLTAGGRRLRCWLPLGLDETEPSEGGPQASMNMSMNMDMLAHMCAPGVFSGADAVRALVHYVQGLLGRPVYRRELAWWVAAHPDLPVARAVHAHLASHERSLTDILGFTAAADARRGAAAAAHVLRRCGDRFSCWGGTAPRYWVGLLTPIAAAADRLDETASGLRVADECACLRDLAQRAARAAALDELVAVRRAALMRARVRALGTDASLVRQARAVLEASYRHCETWAVATAKTADARWNRVEDLRARARHVAALVECDASVADTAKAKRVVVVGPPSAVHIDSLDPFLGALERELSMPRDAVRRLGLRGARRLPLPGGGGRFGRHAVRGDAGVDRVDALLRVYRLVAAPRARALLDAADSLLGPVLRDARVLARFARATDQVPALRRAAMVALALLGQAPAPAVLPADLLDARARLLAETLSGTPPRFTPSAGPVGVAVRRLQAGRLLTAIG